MRIAVSGSHGTGKSTLIAAFLQRCPAYSHEPEAFETLGDDVALTESGEPTPQGLKALLDYTLSAVEGHVAGSRVVFERSPVDYLAYAAAGRGGEWMNAAPGFVSAHVPAVRAAVRQLDLIAYLPLTHDGPAQGRPGEDARFRRRVDDCLRRALLDDEFDVLGERGRPSVIALPSDPRKQLAELVRQAEAADRA